MHLRFKNPTFDYTTLTDRSERVELKSSSVGRNLGVFMSQDIVA